MNHLTSIKLAELRQHDLRVDAAHVRLAAEARRRRRRRFVDWRDHITRRRRRRHAATAPATTTPLARSPQFDELATKFATEGSAANGDELTRFVALAAARGATPTLLSVLADDDRPDVVRQRAFGRVVAELTSQVRGSAGEGSASSDAA